MNKPITIFPDEEMAEKFKQGRESFGMTEEEYFAYLIEQSDEPENPEDEDEEPENDYEYLEDKDEDAENENEDDDEFSEILAGITDVSDKDAIIKELKTQIRAREDEIFLITEELNEVTNYPRINLLFELVRGHTLRISDTDIEVVIRTKTDFIQCLIKNFHYNIDSEDFGVDNDDFEEMEKKAFNKDKEEENDND